MDLTYLNQCLSPELLSLLLGARLLREKLSDNSPEVLRELTERLLALGNKERSAPSGDLAADIAKIRDRKFKKERQ